MNRIEFTQRKNSNNTFLHYDLQNDDIELLGSVSGGNFTDNEIEFLKMKRMRTNKFRNKFYSPDPKLGDYEA